MRWIIFLLLIPAVIADPLTADNLVMSVGLSNIVEVTPTSQNYRIDNVEARLSWVPSQDYRQAVKSILTDPASEIDEDELIFTWKLPKEKELWIELSSSVTTSSSYFKIDERVNFPLKNLEFKMSKYLQEQEIIDMSDDIALIAADLAEGKNDLYEVVFAIGSWVNENIEYSLDTLTAEASQKSSWVLENKRGVCDELTSLFISMIRSLGIPARFVYGEAFSNTLVNDNWGPHGWAEVYFPGYGWVPFDPTYGEYGYVDAGHVKMGHSIDARRPSLKYSMSAKNANINSGYLDMDVDIIRETKPKNPGIELESEIYIQETDFGSYNMLTVTAKNLDDYYKPFTFYLSSPKEVDVDSSKRVLLKPKQEKNLYWLMKVKDDLDPGFSYTFPLTVIAKNEKLETEFKAKDGKKFYEKEYFIIPKEEEKGHDYISIKCDPRNTNVKKEVEFDINCEVENKKVKQEVEVCYEECKELIAEKGITKLTFFGKEGSIGVKNIIIKLKGRDFEKTAYTRVNVIDDANLEIVLDVPEKVTYGESATLVFKLQEISYSTPKNLNVKLEFQDAVRTWHQDSLDSPAKYEILVETFPFTFTNNFIVSVNYEDELGNKYKEEKEFKIKLKDLSLFDRVIVSLNTIGYKVVSFFS